MNQKITVKLKLWGIVQGVGFRPFVAKLASGMDMKGEVCNIGGLVDIVLTDTPGRIDAFEKALRFEKPGPSEIVFIRRESLPDQEFDSFMILDSDNGNDETAMIPTDLPICPECLAEMKDSKNSRYLHPFISCMVCGPRYSIIDRIPYDRINTSMAAFEMCSFCRSEYEGREQRRYHAQTISCHDCGPKLQVWWNPACSENGSKRIATQDVSDVLPRNIEESYEPILQAESLLRQGSIIALKGVGGYNYMCSPFSDKTVKDLRALKVREAKPFAVMFADVNQIRQHCIVTEEEEALLQSNARPIVLLERRLESDICYEVCKTSRFIGSFLPSMGAQHLLLERTGPLIMTSANRSDVPIMKDEEEIFAVDDPRLAAVFYNERKIRIRLDDSVMRIIDGQPQMIRRSKGFAPVPLYINKRAADQGLVTKNDMILATGGQLKSAFCLSKGPFAYVSQYFGDLDSKEACDLYEENVHRMEELFRIKPGLVVSDLHPLYFTTHFANQYGKDIRTMQVQHHHAHVASVMAEHDLQEKVLGVSMDGTGFGTDGTIWGGEFLLCEGDHFQRVGHLEPIPMLGGDSSMKEGWKSAMCYINYYSRAIPRLEETSIAIDSRYQLVKAGIRNRINTIQSSSMGRLFDAVAAFAGIQDTNRYEGECAIMLENAAANALQTKLQPVMMEFQLLEPASTLADRGESAPLVFSAEGIFQSILDATEQGNSKDAIAFGFHCAVARMILRLCLTERQHNAVNQVALTGGVFQNKILMDLTLDLLREESFEVYYNRSVGPNDGGIALGQVYLGMKALEAEKQDQSESGGK